MYYIHAHVHMHTAYIHSQKDKKHSRRQTHTYIHTTHTHFSSTYRSVCVQGEQIEPLFSAGRADSFLRLRDVLQQEVWDGHIDTWKTCSASGGLLYSQ